jgi:hypothetical protein
MPNYQNGKVYSIRSHSRPDLVYVGSTTQPLSKRFGEHKKPSNKTSSKQIIDIGDAYIELIENCACENREQLLKREGEIIRSMNCVNTQIAGRTSQEWSHDNKEHLLEYRKQYSQENAEKISENKKKYYQENRKQRLEKAKQYRQDNRAQIVERLKQKFDCECGVQYTYVHILRHFKSKKHQFYQTTYDYIYS